MGVPVALFGVTWFIVLAAALVKLHMAYGTSELALETNYIFLWVFSWLRDVKVVLLTHLEELIGNYFLSFCWPLLVGVPLVCSPYFISSGQSGCYAHFVHCVPSSI